MEKDFYLTLVNDRIYVDGDDMWFIGIYGNELCKGKISEEKCEYKVQIPTGKEGSFRSSPFCIKHLDNIICIPDRGENIWIYNLEREEFKGIAIDNPRKVRLGITYYWIIDNTLWAWSGLSDGGLKCFIELNLDNYIIKEYHHISENDTLVFAWQLDRYENCIYLFENLQKELYEFNVISKKTKRYKLEDVRGEIETVCCDGENVWLAGEEKCIYIWNKMTGELIRHTDFPLEFQTNDIDQISLNKQKWKFYQSVLLNEYVCFVPLNTSQSMCDSILFMNRKNHSIKVVKIYDGNNGGDRYVLEYVIDGRYVGVHYWPNGFISEIDTETFQIRKKMMKFSHYDYTKMFKNKAIGGLYRENNKNDLEVFIGL